jgi:hypothetical protein
MAHRVLKYGAIAAAFATAAVIAHELWPAPQPVSSSAPAADNNRAPQPSPLAPGFYRPTSDTTNLYQASNGLLEVKSVLNTGACVEVVEGPLQQGYAPVRLRTDDTPPTAVMGYMVPAALRRAPECDALAAAAPPLSTQAPEAPPALEGPEDGFTLNTRVILYNSPEGREPIAVLTPGQCIKVEGVRAAESWTRLSANTERGHVDGWGIDVQYNHFEPCRP